MNKRDFIFDTNAVATFSDATTRSVGSFAPGSSMPLSISESTAKRGADAYLIGV